MADYSKMELKTVLRTELRQYMRIAGYMTGQERNDLFEWVAGGNSVYSNPYCLSGEDGAPLGYIEASRIIDEMINGLDFDIYSDDSALPF